MIISCEIHTKIMEISENPLDTGGFMICATSGPLKLCSVFFNSHTYFKLTLSEIVNLSHTISKSRTQKQNRLC